MTLKERLNSRHNLLNAVRLSLASLVILGHAWPLSGATEPGLLFLAGVAVNGFFIASGYLIAESRIRTALVPFIWRRLLRIYPAFLVSLVMVAAIFAPLAATMEGNPIDVQSAASFVLSNSDLRIDQRGIGGTLTAVPYPIAWNGSLWTLFYETLAYLGIGIVLSISVAVRYAKWVLPGLFIAFFIARILVTGPLSIDNEFVLAVLRLGGYFLAGAALWAYAGTWRPRWWHIFVAGTIYSAMTFADAADLYGQIPLAVLVLGIGSLNSRNWTTHTDLSYGVYIYAFPVQQLLMVFGTEQWGIGVNAFLTLLLVLPLALLSWKLVEKPALRAKRLLDGRANHRDAVKPI